MRYRPFNTSFWYDSYIGELTNSERVLFIFLFTNPRVTTCGIYEFPDKQISGLLDIQRSELETIKSKFEADRRFYFHRGWIYIANFSTHNRFSSAENIVNNFKKELESVPADIYTHFDNQHKYVIPIAQNENLTISVIVTVIVTVIVIRVGGTLGPRVGVEAKQGNEDINPADIPF